MADRETTERVRIDVEGQRALGAAAGEARKLRISLDGIAGGASGAQAALGGVAGAARGVGTSGGPTTLVDQLEDAAQTAETLVDKLARARAETEGLGDHLLSIDQINAKGFAQFQLDRQRGVFKLLEGDKDRGHRLELARIREEGRARQAALLGTSSPNGTPANDVGPARGVGALSSAAPALLAAAAAMGAAALGLARVIAGLTVAGLQLAIDATSFRESTLRSLTMLTRSESVAQELFDRGTRLADELGQTQQTTLRAMNTLLARGFSADGATGAIAVLKAMADLKVVSPGANVDLLITAIAQIKSKGKLALEELQGQLGEQFDIGAVLDVLAKKLGKTSDEVRKLISAGKIDADTGILALLEAIQGKTGKELGGAAADAANSVSVLIARLAGMPTRFFDEIDMKPLQGALKGIIDWLNGAGGDGLKKAITSAGSSLVKLLFGPFSGPEGAARLSALGAGITRIFENLGAFFEAAAPVVESFFDGLFTILETLGDGDAGAGMMVLVDALVMGVTSATAFLQLVGAIVDAAQRIADALRGLGGVFTGEGLSMGAQLVDGIVQGIVGAIPRAVGAVVGLASQVTSAARGPAGFDAHSPSRKFEEIGETLPAGLARAASNDNSARSAVETMAAGATGAAQGAVDGAPAARGAAGGGGGAAAGGGGNVYVTINVAPGGDAQGTAVAVADEFERRFGRRVRRIGEAA